jgi:nicotinate phosphoribosyltransferase
VSPKPRNEFKRALLTDFYELTMAYAYFKSGKHEDPAVFDLFFRKNPFGGEFTIFAGLSEVLRFVRDFRFTVEDIAYICSVMPHCEEGFREWLRTIDCSRVRIYAIAEGSVVFPRVPLLRVEGPLGVTQLLESALLNLVSYPSLVTTNAARMKMAAGEGKTMVEFGLRRAQGPDGAVSASRYSYLGGFAGTSNVLAGLLYSIPISGTQAHAFVSSFFDLNDVDGSSLVDTEGKQQDFVETVLAYRKELEYRETNEGELASFIAYARAFPENFLALVDTYDTLKSGVKNFICVALALHKFGYQPIGIRLDSGDLAHLSKAVRKVFKEISGRFHVPFTDLKIVASNEINEPTLYSLNQQGHEIDIFGVGTHLVTCQSQPSLGCVYKLVEVDGKPRIKLSQDTAKITIPGRKTAYRLYGREGYPLVDIMLNVDEPAPEPRVRILCCHPHEEAKRTYVTPQKVETLHSMVWDGVKIAPLPALEEVRERVDSQLRSLRPDHLRMLNPTPYKVSLSRDLYEFMRELWLKESPLEEIF